MVSKTYIRAQWLQSEICGSFIEKDIGQFKMVKVIK